MKVITVFVLEVLVAVVTIAGGAGAAEKNSISNISAARMPKYQDDVRDPLHACACRCSRLTPGYNVIASANSTDSKKPGPNSCVQAPYVNSLEEFNKPHESITEQCCSFLYPVKADTNAFDAARLAAELAKNDPQNAARIVADTAAQLCSDINDLGLIIASVMHTLNIADFRKQAQFMGDVEALKCSAVPLAQLQQSLGAFPYLNPGSPGNTNNPANPTGPADMDDAGTTNPGGVSDDHPKPKPGPPVSPD